MEIRIDTNKDSKEEIRKIIKFLNDVVNEQSSNNSPRNTPDVPDANPSMFGMFSEDTNSARDINIQTDESELEPEPKPRIDIIPY